MSTKICAEIKRKDAVRLGSPFIGLRLLLPAIIPSWRFFDEVAASPRLDYALLTAPGERTVQWRAFRPRPAVLSPSGMLRRLFWNPQWNEDLFLISLAERLMSKATAETTAHSEHELLLRVARHLDRSTVADRGIYLQIRLRVVDRAGSSERIRSETVYLSSPCPMAGLITP